MASPSSFGNGPTALYPFAFDEILVNVHRIMEFEWDTIIHLSKSQKIEELEWLLCLFTACDPSLERTCPFWQDDYHRLTTFLLDPKTWKEDRDLEAIYALEDTNFIALDVEDRGLALGLKLYDILLPRERP